MPAEGHLLLHVVLSVIVIAAALHDARTRRDPKRLTYPLALVGLALAVARTIWGEFTLAHWSVIGLAVILATLLLGSGAYGGGDAKLFVALALVLPTAGYLYAQLVAFVLGAVVVLALNDPAARWQELRVLWGGLVRGQWPTLAAGSRDGESSLASGSAAASNPREPRRWPATWQLALGALAAMWVVPLVWPGR